MSYLDHTPMPVSSVSAAGARVYSLAAHGAEGLAIPPTPARLQVIHDLVRAGDYQVPAIAVAERMVEQMVWSARSRPS